MTGPHAGTIDDIVSMDVSKLSFDSGRSSIFLQYTVDRYVFDNFDTTLASSLCEGDRYVYGINPSIFFDIKSSEHIIDVGDGK